MPVRRGPARFAFLSLPLLLLACSQSPDPADNPYAGGKTYPWSSRLEAPVADPYAAGRDYSWTGPKAATGIGAQALGSGDNFLSDLTWTSATNSWGPVEKDRSNGEQAAGDGRTLTIGGQTFAKGLGMHAAGEVSYALGGACSTFSASIGIDDEVGDRGSVAFQVWNGTTTKLYDSGVVRGTDGPKAISAPVSGVQNLRLVVTDGGDGINYDHADWANAKVSCTATAPVGNVYLTDLTPTSSSNGWGPFERDRSNGEQGLGDGRTLTLAGQTHAKGLGVHSPSTLTYSLGGACTRFSANVGVDDEVGDRGSVTFQVYLDGVKAYDSGTVNGASATRAVDLDTTGKGELRLVVTDAGDGPNYDHADWADARLACTTTASPVRHLQYVVVDRAIKVYDIDQGYTLVKTIPVPNMYRPRGVAANAVNDRLYIPYWGDRDDPQYAGQPKFGYLTSIDLRTEQVVWTRKYSPSIDSLQITPDGKKLYMPSGEDGTSDFWFVLDAATGNELTRIKVHERAHNTNIGSSGKRVYMGSIKSNYLWVADTATDQVTGKIGPFFTSGENSGIRPFVVNHAETLVFVNVDHFSGFEIGDIMTGQKLFSVPVQGFPWVDSQWPITQSHGVALSPNEKEVWVLDSYNRYVHIFDVTGLPSQAPRQVAGIDVRDAADVNNLPKWVNFTRDGRYAQISTGAVIDTATRKIVRKLDNTRYYLQIDMQGTEPVAAYSRYGLGYGGTTP